MTSSTPIRTSGIATIAPSIITDQRGHVTTAAERSIMRRLLRENSLSIVMFGLFLETGS